MSSSHLAFRLASTSAAGVRTDTGGPVSTEVLLNLITAIVCNEAFETSKNDEADLAKQPLS